MLRITPFGTHAIEYTQAKEYDAWFEKYLDVYDSELLAIKKHLDQLPENAKGIEVGLGTGRYAAPLGITEGVEQAKALRNIAKERCIEVMDATAEHLPYTDLHTDFVLFVTFGYLDNVYKALKEANRVLKREGTVIIAFIDKNIPFGKKYVQKRNNSIFYEHTRFYSVNDIITLLREAKFKNPVITQTLFADIDSIKRTEEPKYGYGEGSFVVVRATKITKTNNGTNNHFNIDYLQHGLCE